MKENIKKVFAILVLFILMINSSFLTVISTAIDAIENLIDEAKVNSTIEVDLEKYVNYKISDESSGALLQFNIKTGIEYEEEQEYIPIKATNTVINLPQIAGKYPDSLEVLTKSTKATNGDDNGKDMHYNYNKETGKLEIVVSNEEDNNGEIYTENLDGARDEFVVISNYGADSYNDRNEKRDLNVTGTIEEILANEDKTKISDDWTINFEVSEDVSGLISTEITTSDIYNGYINSNEQNGTQKETEYTENMSINVSYRDISEELIIESTNEFLNAQNEEIETEEIVYKSTKVNKQNVVDILGKEGRLQILNQSGEVLGEINGETEENEDGTVEINYENEQTEIIIKTTNPVKLGTIEIESQKAIKETMTEIEVNKILAKNTIEAINNVQEKDEKTQEIIKEYTEEIYNFKNTQEIEIKDSETKVELSVDKTEWTNNAQNDVTINLTLVSNGPQYNLFKNPVIEIKLPVEIENVILGEISLLYDNNLSIKNSEVIDKDNCKVVRLEIEGTQNEYISNSMITGANIVIPATVIVKKDIDSVDSKIEMNYSNESGIVNDYQHSGLNSKQYDIKIVDTLGVGSIEPVIPDEEKDSSTNIEDLDVELYAQVGSDVIEDGDIVYEGEIITYTMKITNTSSTAVKNVRFKGTVPDGTTYVTKDGSVVNPDRNTSEAVIRNDLWIFSEDKKQESILIDSISVGETVVKTYKVMVDDLEEGEDSQNQITAVLNAYINDKEISNKTISAVANSAKLSVEIYPGMPKYVASSNYGYAFYINVINRTDEDIDNIYVESKLADEMDIVFATANDEDYSFDKDTNTVKIKIGKINANSTSQFYLILSANNFTEGKYEYKIPVNLTVYGENTDTYRSDTEYEIAYYTSVSIVNESSSEGKKLEAYEEIEYKITVTNEGLEDTYVKIIDNMPDGIEAIKAIYEKYIYNGETEEYEKTTEEKSLTSKLSSETNDFELETYILKGNSIEITIYARAVAVGEIIEVENVAMVQGEKIKSKVSNSIKNTILPYGYIETETPVDPDDSDNSENPDNPDNPNSPDNPENPDDSDASKKYDINGIVWIDENKDGKRSDEEDILSGVTVKLFNADTNAIVTDENNNALKTQTNQQGKYEFEGINKGNYLVLFEYDTNTYEITSYQKNGVTEEFNSDVIKKEVSIDGNTKQVGVTDILIISNKDLNNIDMGLIKNPIFDFKLDKYISKITVENSEGTKEEVYENEKLAKVEIPAKQLNNTTVKIEYKIIVTNEGEVSGYVDEIIDYIPSSLTFNSENNIGWTRDESGNLENTSLATEKINPGESKEVTLVLTKKMTETSTGIVINEAEIGETKNTSNLLDIDSTEKNKIDTEDDFSEAEVIISIKTGIITYIIYIVIALGIVSIALILIKNKKMKFLSIMCVISAIMIVSLQQYSNGEDSETRLINIRQLKGHVVNGVRWEYKFQDGGYWCLDPGWYLPLGTEEIEKYYEYTLWRSTYRGGTEIKFHDGKPFTTEESFSAWITKYNPNGDTSKTLPYNGVLKDWVSTYFQGVQNPSFEDVKIDGKNATLKKQKDSYGIVGPYIINYSYSDCEIQEVAIKTCKINGNEISGAYICDQNGMKISKVNSGEEIYIYVPSSDVSTIQFSIVLTSDYVKLRGLDVELWKSPGMHEGTNVAQALFEMRPREILDKVYGYSEEIDTKLTGDLKIVKYDTDTKSKLEGAYFTITGPNYKVENQVTNSNGELILTGLVPGIYTITETKAPEQYDIDLQTEKSKTVEVKAGYTVTLGKSATAEFYNKQYGSLEVTKLDAYTKNTQLGGITLNDIQFKIYILKGVTKYYLNSSANGSIKDDTHYEYTDFNQTNKEKGKIFTTSGNAQFIVENLPVYEGGTKITYYIEEYALPSNLQLYYDLSTEVVDVTLSNGDITEGIVKNEQLYVSLSGYVWEDIHSSKATIRNDLYKTNSSDYQDEYVDDQDTSFNGIIVRLKDKKGNILEETVSNEIGLYSEIDGGEYIFNRILIDQLSEYYVEFEYDGLIYQSVKPHIDIDSGSKATDETEREILDKNFTSVNSTGENKVNIDDKYSITYNDTVDHATSIKDSSCCILHANTLDTKYDIFEYYSFGTTEIKYINLGLYEKPQADLSLTQDLQSVNVGVNGYWHIYNYAQRVYDNNEFDLNDSDTWNLGIKFKNSYTGTYKRAIYKADYNYENPEDRNNELQVYLTYKIGITNESSYLTKANKIVDYFDSRYTLIGVGTELDAQNNITGNISYQTPEEYNDMYKKCVIDVNTVVKSGETNYIYVQFKLDRVAILQIMNNGETLSNTAEIDSYTVFKDDNGNTVAAVDRDSVPGNTKVENKDTYEDDTDSAPSIQLELSGARKIAGTVFVDSTTGELLTGQIRQGNGILDDGETTIAGVKVTLKDVEGNVVQIYNEETKNWENAESKTDENGNFEIVGYIPGQYTITYTWGDKTYTVQSYKGTIYDSSRDQSNMYWYKDQVDTRKTDAIDDYQTRLSIDNETALITDNTINDQIADAYNGGDNHPNITITTMDSTTPTMEFGVEYETTITDGMIDKVEFIVKNVDFGIVERARQQLDIVKRVSSFKIILANGQILVEATVDENGELQGTHNYVTYMGPSENNGYSNNGFIKAEMDDELIEGASLEVGYEIKFINNSELDYMSENYYKYGIEEGDIVTLIPSAVVDYLDKDLNFQQEKNSDWQQITESELKDLHAVKVGDKDFLNSKIILYTEKTATVLEPKETVAVDLNVSKLLTTSDDLTFNNDAETLTISKPKDPKYEKEHKGSVIKYFPIDDAEEVQITPSTGADKNYVVPIVVGMMSLVVFGFGIFAIKKFVIK